MTGRREKKMQDDAAARSVLSPTLDPFDRAILAILQRNNRTPQHEIGARVNLSAAAVQRRIRRMEERGVIRANTAVLDPAKVGRPVTLIVGVEVDSERADWLAATRTRLAEAPEVQQCYYVTGDVDFILVISAASMAEYEAISHRLFREDANVRRFRTFVVMSSPKATLEVPLA